MLFFSVNTNRYWQLGLALLLGLLNVFIVGFPPFQVGMWVQSEPAVFALFVFASLIALWLGIGCLCRWLTIPPSLSPIAIVLLAWLGWQCVMTATALLPWRSWFGPPQTGDGTGVSLVTLLTVWLAYVLWQRMECRRAIILVAAVSVLIQCTLHIYYPPIPGNVYMPDRWMPAEWPEYLPFLAGYIWVAAFAGGYVRSGKNYALSVVAMVVLLFVSYNQSAALLFGGALIVTTVVRAFPWLQPSRYCRILALVACVLPFSLTLISPVVPEPGSDSHPSGVLKVFSQINEGFGSRMMLDRVGMSVLSHEPQRLLIGNGWGTFTDDLLKYGLVDGVYTYKNGKRDPNWFLVDGTSHHSHNQPLEALLSLGLIGLILWYAVPMLALWTLPDALFWSCAPMVVAITGLGHFWFQLPQCFPYQALYLAALISVCGGKKNAVPFLTTFRLGIACIIVFFVMAASAYGQYKAMMYAEHVHEAITTKSYKDYNEIWLAEDLNYGGDRWMNLVRFYATDTENKAGEHALNDNIIGWYLDFIHVAHKAAQDPHIGARTSYMELRLLFPLVTSCTEPICNPLLIELIKNFEDATVRFMHKVPLRDDYTTFFLVSMPDFTHRDTAHQMQLLEHMLAIAPHNRCALWLLGRMYLNIPGKETQGRDMVRKAIASHVEQAYPITNAELQAAMQTVGGALLEPVAY